MNLSISPMREHDQAECLRLVPADPSLPTGTQERLPAVWSELRARGALNAIVVADRDQPKGRQIVLFGTSVFVTDTFARQICAAPPPSVGGALVMRFLAGDSPILERRQIARANASSGLTLVVLYANMPTPDKSQEKTHAIIAAGPESFLILHAGFRLKEVLIQPLNELFRQFCLGSGYRERLPETAGTAPLVGLTREEAWADPGTYAARLFAYRPPRLFLRPLEQEMLACALRGETDEEIAMVLSLALPTIKTRWRQVYNRVSAAVPDLLPDISDSHSSLRRGLEKRRRLLTYLRDHPEELRPFSTA